MVSCFRSIFLFISLMSCVFCQVNVAEAAQYEGNTVTKVVMRSGKNLSGESKLDLDISADVYRVSVEPQWVEEQVFECEDDDAGDGRKGNWHGFYEARKEDKPARLAEAIRGVGLATAKRLVEDGYFQSKPRSWREFKRRIEEADKQYETGFSYEVLNKNKKENMINLGYLVEGQCNYRIEKVLQMVPVRKYHVTKTRHYELRISGAPLLSGESEKLSISFDGFDDSIVTNSWFNSYNVERWTSNETVVFELKGTRKLVQPSNQLNLSAVNFQGKLKLQVQDGEFDSDIASRCKRFIVGSVAVDRTGWKSDVPVGSFEGELSSQSTSTTLDNTGIQVDSGTDLIIHYQIRYEGSPFHGSESSSAKTLRMRF